jgi:hypothetical protein
MNYFKKLLVTVAALFVLGAVQQLYAETESVSSHEKQVSGETRIDFSNNYYFRGGYLFEEGTLGAFPSATIALADPAFSLNVWGAFPLMNRSKGKNETAKDELDFTLNYSASLTEKLSLSVGGVIYTNLFIDDNTIQKSFMLYCLMT